MKKYFPVLFIIIFSCTANVENKNIVKDTLATNTIVTINDTLTKIKQLMEATNRFSDFDSLPDRLIIFPKHYFDTASVSFLCNKLKAPIDLCYILNHSTFTYTSSVINGTHLMKLHPKGNFEICYLLPHITDTEMDAPLSSPDKDTAFLSAEIILFTNYPLTCKQELFVGFLTASARIPVLKNIKVGDHFKTVINKLGYSYLKSGNVLYYHDWNNTVAKFIIKNNSVKEISVVRYDFDLSRTPIPEFVINGKMIPERPEGSW